MYKHLLPVILLFIFSLWSLRSIFHPGFMYSHDSLWHVERLINLSSLIPTQFPVRWSPTLDNGYGIPLFNFTYPAPYYLGALLMFLGLGPVKAYYALLFFGYFIGGLGIYALGRRRPLSGFFAALLYLLTPYQFLDIFVRGALGEVMALGIIPWVILAYEDISRTGRSQWYTALPMALLLLSHNFYAYLFTGLFVVFTLILYRHRLKILASFLLSLGLSAFFVLPAFWEKSFLLITQSASASFLAHFVYPSQLLYSPWVYLGSVAGADPNEMSFQLGLANLLLVVLASLILVYRWLKRSPALQLTVLLILFFGAVFMTLPQSAWFWSHLPLLPSLQFPWRFLGVAAVLSPLIYLELARLASPKHAHSFLVLSLLIVGLALYNTRNYYRPVKWMSEAEFLALHYEYTGKNTTAHRNELVPRWAPVERYAPADGQRLVIQGDGEITAYQDSPESVAFSAVSPGNQSQAILHRNYFPLWQARVDGRRSILTPTPTGEISLTLLPGAHSYQIFLASTPVEIIGNGVSVMAVLLVIYLAYSKPKSSRSPRSSLRRTSTPA